MLCLFPDDAAGTPSCCHTTDILPEAPITGRPAPRNIFRRLKHHPGYFPRGGLPNKEFKSIKDLNTFILYLNEHSNKFTKKSMVAGNSAGRAIADNKHVY
jgi:hypothetical protein